MRTNLIIYPITSHSLHTAGETVFYNSNLLHCATYEPHEPRVTLHACMGSSKGGSSRARNILQHGLEWMKGEEFKKGLDEKSLVMLEKLLQMERESGGAERVGYSLEN